MQQLKPVNNVEKGQSLMELGVVIVIMLILLAGVVDLGRAFFQFQAMRDAAQEGAAYGSIYPTSCNQAIERVRQNLTTANQADFQVEIRINGVQCHLASAADACAEKDIKVSVRQPNFSLSMPFLGAILGSQTIPLNAEVTSSIIRPPCSP